MLAIRTRTAAVVAAGVLLISPLHVHESAAQSGGPRPATPLLPQLTIIAPAAPGGGWDQLAREMQRELDRQRIAAVTQVENIPGAAGTIGLAHLIDARRGDGQVLLVNGLVMLGAILWNESPVSIAQVTPIARLTGEYEVVAVPSASPYRDLRDLVRALQHNPAGVSWGGGSAGGTDHMLAGLIVAAAGLDPRRTNYIAYSGGGEAVTSLIGGQVTAGISGYSEFAPHVESGRLRVIGVSSPTRLAAVDAPTLTEQGLDVILENWRAVVAPPGLEPSEQRTLIDAVDRMVHSDGWRDTLAKLGWSDSYLAGAEFQAFLDDERIRVARIVSRLRGAAGRTGQVAVGEWVFPGLVIGASILVLGWLAAARGRPRSDASAAHRPVLRVALGLVAFVALLNALGFVVAGTLLFACTTSAFGSRRWPRDLIVGFALCLVVFVAFTRGLGVALP